jgi:hypothetical protein
MWLCGIVCGVQVLTFENILEAVPWRAGGRLDTVPQIIGEFPLDWVVGLA